MTFNSYKKEYCYKFLSGILKLNEKKLVNSGGSDYRQLSETPLFPSCICLGYLMFIYHQDHCDQFFSHWFFL